MNLNDLINKRADEPHYKQTKRGLKIFDLNTLDNGIYACTNSSETYSYDLQVAYAPYFDRYPQETMMIRRNETVLLDCTAKGYPKPQVSKIIRIIVTYSIGTFIMYYKIVRCTLCFCFFVFEKLMLYF